MNIVKVAVGKNGDQCPGILRRKSPLPKLYVLRCAATECVFSQSLRTSLILASPPAPISLNALTISVSNRILTGVLVCYNAGRLRRFGLSISAATTVPNNSGKTAEAGLA
jgi:hypothetical protein